MTTNIGTARTMAIQAPARLPLAAQLMASRPFPESRRRWPGRTESTVSSSGAPRKTDGMKSTKECTTEAEMMTEQTSSGT